MNTCRDIVSQHFDGDHELYEDYLAACRLQFAKDIEAGDTACGVDDASLRRLAHSLKGVLQMLGDDPASALARELESAAAGRQDVGPLWQALRCRLQQHATG